MRRLGPSRWPKEGPSPLDDVTQRERAEALRWRSVFENSAIGVALADENGRVLATNTTLQKMLGYTESELEGLSFLDITHEHYRKRNWTLFNELVQGKQI